MFVKKVGIYLFLKRKKAKGNFYYYLCCYDKNSPSNVKMAYKFGRKELAATKMKIWISNLEEFPEELIDAGCGPEDIERWISKVEEVV